jgi:two-component system LytT family response regulator
MPRPLRILIADDELQVRDALRGALEADPRADVVGECADGLAALEACDELHPDVLFLDVEMPILTGLEVAGQLEKAQRPAIVFVTPWDPYAVRAFEHDAVDYLVKPFDDTGVRDVLRRAVDRPAERTIPLEATLGDLARHVHTPVRFVATIAERKQVIDAAAIDWIEAAGDQVRLHTGHDSMLVREPMTSIEERLNPDEFARVQPATIVRLARVRELAPTDAGDYKLFLTTGDTVTLGRAYRNQVIPRLNR